MKESIRPIPFHATYLQFDGVIEAVAVAVGRGGVCVMQFCKHQGHADSVQAPREAEVADGEIYRAWSGRSRYDS